MIMKNMKNLIFVFLFSIFAITSSSSVFADKINGINPDLEEGATETTSTVKGTYEQVAQKNGWDNNNWDSKNGNGWDTKEEKVCKWIKLNTDVPFVWRCIGTTTSDKTTQLNAFPKLMWAMMRLIMTVIMVLSILMIVVAGVMMTTGGFEKGNYTKGLEIIKKVAVGIALLWASGVILKLINPNFFV